MIGALNGSPNVTFTTALDYLKARLRSVYRQQMDGMVEMFVMFFSGIYGVARRLVSFADWQRCRKLILRCLLRCSTAYLPASVAYRAAPSKAFCLPLSTARCAPSAVHFVPCCYSAYVCPDWLCRWQLEFVLFTSRLAFFILLRPATPMQLCSGLFFCLPHFMWWCAFPCVFSHAAFHYSENLPRIKQLIVRRITPTL